MTGAPDLHTLSGAYASDALGEEERSAFEHHLDQCEPCAREVIEFAATLARLGAAEALAPPPGLKARVLAAVPSVRQLPRPQGAEPLVSPVSPVPPVRERRRGRWTRHWPKVAVAASLALAATLGGIAVQQHDQARRVRAAAARQQAEQDRFGALLTAPDERTATAIAAGGSGTGTVVWSVGLGRAGFFDEGMPALAPGTTYELWFNDSGTLRPAGLMPLTSGSILLTGPLDGAVGVGVTVEPAAGSAHPSGNPVMLLPFR